MRDPVQEFEASRRLLEGIAYRMLGTLAEAQDVVQETYLRWRAVDTAAIREPTAWLVTVCTRLATNVLRSARVRRESYVGTWLPEPWAPEGDGADQRMELDESVSAAFLVALEALSPLERAAFLLHDVFDYDFEHIARTLRRSTEACRKLASRARAAVRAARPEPSAPLAEHRAAVEAFILALRAGDVAAIERSLARGARMYADGGGKVSATAPREGAAAIAALFAEIFEKFARAGTVYEVEPRWFSGALGLVLREDGALATAMSLETRDGLIWAIHAQRNPDKLARAGLGP